MPRDWEMLGAPRVRGESFIAWPGAEKRCPARLPNESGNIEDRMATSEG